MKKKILTIVVVLLILGAAYAIFKALRPKPTVVVPDVSTPPSGGGGGTQTQTGSGSVTPPEEESSIGGALTPMNIGCGGNYTNNTDQPWDTMDFSNNVGRCGRVVYVLQKQLQLAGQNIVADGKYGPNTAAAHQIVFGNAAGTVNPIVAGDQSALEGINSIQNVNDAQAFVLDIVDGQDDDDASDSVLENFLETLSFGIFDF